MNFEVIYKNLVKGLSSYIKENNLKAMILGISGGLDSTIVASIAQDASKEVGVPFISYSQENPQVFSLWDELVINKYYIK